MAVESQIGVTEGAGDGRETTRRRMLDAGIDLWSTEPVADLFAGLSVARIARAAGVSRTTFYAYWSATDEYLLDLARHLATSDEPARRSPTTELDAPLVEDGGDIVNRFLAASDAYVRQLCDDARLRLRLGLLSRLDDDDLAEQLRRAVDHVGPIESELFTDEAPLWIRSTRAPLEDHHLRAVFTAMAEGLAIRHLLDPERYPIRIYGLATLSMLLVLTSRHEVDRSIYEVLSVANQWAADAIDRRTRSSDGDEDDAGEPLHDDEILRMVAVAQRVAAATSWDSVNLPGIAMISSVPEPRVIEVFGSRAGLFMAVFLHNVSRSYDALEISDDALADLRAMLTISAAEQRRSPVFVQSMLAILSGTVTYNPPSSFPFDPHPRVEAAVARAQAAGQLDEGIPAPELASILNRALLISNLPAGGAVMPTGATVELILRGAGATPPPE